MKVLFLTTWGDTVCGIRDYSEHLVQTLSGLVDLEVVPLDPSRCTGPDGVAYAADLGRMLNRGDLVHIQHDYSFFGDGLLPAKVAAARIGPSPGTRFFFMREQIRIPVVMTAHEVLAREPQIHGRNLPKVLFLRYRQRRAHRRIFDTAERCMVHSKMHKQRLVRLGVRAARIRLIPHGIPLDRFPGPEGPADAGAWPESGSGEPFKLVIFGFINRRKGHLLALDALARLPGRFVLTMAGGRHPRDESLDFEHVQEVIRDKGLEARVRITGYLSLEDGYRMLRDAHLVLVPQIDDFVSGSMTHALVSGKPIVASDVQANREIHERHPCLALFSSGDADALHRSIVALSNDAEERSRLGRRAREYAERHTYSAIAKMIVEVYREVIHTRVKGA